MIIYGKNVILCALNSKFKISKVLIYENLRDKDKFIQLCKSKNVPYELVSKFRLEQLVKEDNHQGLCAYFEDEIQIKVQDNINNFIKSKENKIILIIDRIQDPHNFGSIIRTAQILNVNNIISTYTQSVKITPSVIKASAGAIFYINFSYSDNLKRIIQILKENQVRIYSLERNGEYIENVSIGSEKIALIVGSEHYGIRSSLIQLSEKILTLRTYNNQINSYNVSNAVSIALYILTVKSLKLN
ncbi:MAG: 23S rRNA (guanosine(2251)-2'-O)-methyltransferase RlmB [candidate division WOR-3 bacterium]